MILLGRFSNVSIRRSCWNWTITTYCFAKYGVHQASQHKHILRYFVETQISRLKCSGFIIKYKLNQSRYFNISI